MNNDSADDTTDIKFNVYSDNSNAFSIRCGKCADIHNAQLEGKTTEACKCDCHGKPNPITYIPYCPPDPCCPQFPPYEPIWQWTNGTADPFPNRGYTFCNNAGAQLTPCFRHIDYATGGCNCQ